MKDINRRNYDEFKKRTRIFLKENYYFIVQNYIINFIVNESQNYFINFFSLFFDELCGIIRTLLDINNNNVLIRQHIEICYKKKLNSFYNNIITKTGNFIKKELFSNLPQLIPPYIPDKNFVDENIIPFEKDDSLIFKNIKLNNFAHSIQNIEMKKNNLGIKQENNWKLLKEDLREKINNFLKEITYQESSIMLNYEDETFNLLQIVIKKDLINFFNNNINQYFEEICSNYNNQNSKFVKNGESNNDIIDSVLDAICGYDDYIRECNKNSIDSNKIIIENKSNLQENIKNSKSLGIDSLFSSENKEQKYFLNNPQILNEVENNNFNNQNSELINNYEESEIEEIINNEDIVLYFKNDYKSDFRK